ncbi:MAG: hypothetical protein Q7R98_01600 [Candidatus Jorgensenbacteria bacterium]|nr:hypothetical protein [Candidatus Jorgensenbacteria bacterium]
MDSKGLKFIAILLSATIVLGASLPFISYAQTSGDDANTPATRNLVPSPDLANPNNIIAPAPTAEKLIDEKKASTNKCFIKTGMNMLLQEVTGLISSGISSGLSFLTGGIIGGEQRVKETGLRDIVNTQSIQTCITDIMNQAGKIALYNFKKRLLDRMTDQTISWIRGDGGKPQFVTNFTGFMRDAADKAAGDTLIDIGLGNLCYGNAFRFNINLQLQQSVPPAERYSCTLSQVMDNAAGFRDNFTTGGWLGYYELLKPQNNQYGLAYMTYEDYQKKKAEEEAKKQAQFNVSAGFTPTEQCTQWRLLGTFNGFEQEILGPTLNTSKFPDPTKPPTYNPSDPSQDLVPENFSNARNLRWNCKNTETTLPYTVKEAATNKAFTSDTDYLLSADDLTPYMSMIFDAAVNRLISSGVKGIKNSASDIFSETTTGRKSTPLTASAAGTAGLLQGATDYRNAGNLGASLVQTVNNLIASTTQAWQDENALLPEVIALNARVANNDAADTMTEKLLVCQKDRTLNGIMSGDGCANTNTAVSSAKNLATSLSTMQSDLDQATAIIAQARNIQSSAESSDDNTLISLITSLNSVLSSLQSNVQALGTLKTQLQLTIKQFSDEKVLCENRAKEYICPAQSALNTSAISATASATGSGARTATTSESFMSQ